VNTNKESNIVVLLHVGSFYIILGAHAIGRGAGDWMQEVVFAKQYKRKLGDISQVIHPYPNHAAAVQRTADLYWREALFTGWIPKVIKKYIQWFR
jgi:pyruvate/2-oxoglutarate dehydrogenase complex dihydrolipoamide dehydrogenase (E3) component